MAPSIYDWSTTAANNSNADGDINWAEGQAPSTVNNSARQTLARVAEFLKDIGGSISAGGTANALTVTAGSSFTTYAAGRYIAFKATADNTGAATLNVNSIGAKSIRIMTTSGDTAISSGFIQNGGIYVVRYSTTANSSAGGWILMNPTVGFGTAGNYDVGTSGATVPLNNTANTFGTTQTFAYSSNPAVVVEKVGAPSNAIVQYKTTAASMYAGVGTNAATWAIGTAADLTSTANRLFSVTSTNAFFGTQAEATPGVGGDATDAGITINHASHIQYISSTNDGMLTLSRPSFDPGGNYFMQYFRLAGTVVGSIEALGGGTINFNQSSDQRLKEDFRDFDAGAIIDRMKMYHYTWKASGVKSYGPKAQELYEVFPEAVSVGTDNEPGDEDFRPWQWQGNQLTALLIREVQSLRKRIAALEAA